MVTAGGTAEPIDPVRFIGNRSSGRMGVAIAEAALARGARVTLIHGMTSVPLPEAADLVDAPTAAAMRDAVLAALPDAGRAVMAAAVADFRPSGVGDDQARPRRRPDARAGADRGHPRRGVGARPRAIAARVAGAPPPILVGFAAETGSLERAPEKAARKGVDLLVANDVSEPGSGFGTDTNRVTIIAPGSRPSRGRS